MLCSLCASIFEGEKELDVSYKWHISAKDVQISAYRGCLLCRDVRRTFNGVQYEYRGGIRKSWTYKLQAHNNLDRTELRLVFLEVDHASEPFTIQLRDRIGDLNFEAPCFDYNTSEQLLDRLGAELALAWLKNCCENHDKCKIPNPEGWTPARLIDVCSQPPCLREGSQIPAGAAYNTLSHRWRTEPIERLCTKNLSIFKKAIPQEALSKLFSDAIEFTKRAGIQYLWIDSLCIIQDSENDWPTESASMDRIYQHGSCNLAAAAAAVTSSYYGTCADLNIDRSQTQRQGPVYVKTKWTNLPNAHLTWDVDWSVWVPPSMDTSSSLYARCWVMQELCLSPRTVHFGIQRFDWECRTGFASEMWPMQIPQYEILKSFQIHRPYQMTGWGQHSHSLKWPMEQGLDKAQIAQRWTGLAGKYLTCHLTYKKDILVAFSALARGFASLLHDQYLAGLWKRSLIPHLDWYIHNTSDTEGLALDYTAPSWSFASVVHARPVFPMRCTGHGVMRHSFELAKTVEASTVPTHHDAIYGAVKAGHVIIRGLPRSLRRVLRSSKSRPYGIDWKTAAAHVGFDMKGFKEEHELSHEAAGGKIRGFEIIAWVNYSTREIPSTETLLCLPTLVYKQMVDAKHASHVTVAIVGILLQPCDDEAAGYQRIGSFHFGLFYKVDGSFGFPAEIWELERDFLTSIILGQKAQEPTEDDGDIFDGVSDVRII